MSSPRGSHHAAGGTAFMPTTPARLTMAAEEDSPLPPPPVLSIPTEAAVRPHSASSSSAASAPRASAVGRSSSAAAAGSSRIDVEPALKPATAASTASTTRREGSPRSLAASLGAPRPPSSGAGAASATTGGAGGSGVGASRNRLGSTLGLAKARRPQLATANNLNHHHHHAARANAGGSDASPPTLVGSAAAASVRPRSRSQRESSAVDAFAGGLADVDEDGAAAVAEGAGRPKPLHGDARAAAEAGRESPRPRPASPTPPPPPPPSHRQHSPRNPVEGAASHDATSPPPPGHAAHAPYEGELPNSRRSSVGARNELASSVRRAAATTADEAGHHHLGGGGGGGSERGTSSPDPAAAAASAASAGDRAAAQATATRGATSSNGGAAMYQTPGMTTSRTLRAGSTANSRSVLRLGRAVSASHQPARRVAAYQDNEEEERQPLDEAASSRARDAAQHGDDGDAGSYTPPSDGMRSAANSDERRRRHAVDAELAEGNQHQRRAPGASTLTATSRRTPGAGLAAASARSYASGAPPHRLSRELLEQASLDPMRALSEEPPPSDEGRGDVAAWDAAADDGGGFGDGPVPTVTLGADEEDEGDDDQPCAPPPARSEHHPNAAARHRGGVAAAAAVPASGKENAFGLSGQDALLHQHPQQKEHHHQHRKTAQRVDERPPHHYAGAGAEEPQGGRARPPLVQLNGHHATGAAAAPAWPQAQPPPPPPQPSRAAAFVGPPPPPPPPHPEQVQPYPDEDAEAVEFFHRLSQEAARQRESGVAESATRPTKDLKEVTLKGFKFKKVSRAGQGGFSTVFRVRGPCAWPDGTPVAEEEQAYFAMKQVTLKRLEPSSRAEVVREAELLSQLAREPGNERYILKYYCHRTSSQSLKILLELGDCDLTEVFREGPLPRERLCDFWRQMLETVHFVHERGGLVHTDLKPANFLMVGGRLKLIDFGIAQKIPLGTIHISRDGIVGTPNYMAPEACLAKEGKKYKAGKASDVWSLGCILYQMVYGRPPFDGIPSDRKLAAITNPKHKIELRPTRGIPAASPPPPPSSDDASGGGGGVGSGGGVDGHGHVRPAPAAVDQEVDAWLAHCMRSSLRYRAEERATIPELLCHPFSLSYHVSLDRATLASMVARLVRAGLSQGLSDAELQSRVSIAFDNMLSDQAEVRAKVRVPPVGTTTTTTATTGDDDGDESTA